jgi:short-subunit dehydrogenase
LLAGWTDPAQPQRPTAQTYLAGVVRDLRGRVVVITGGARGIGAAAAVELASLGARVAIGDLDAAAARVTAAELPDALGLSLDVTKTASYQAFLAEVTDRLGPIDILVANAGVMWVGSFAREPESSIQRQFAVNVDGVLRGFRLATPAMVARGHGQVIVVASAASKLAPAGEATYAATKHAVYGYAAAVREELRGSGVVVSVVMPTVVDTALAAGTSSGRVRMLSVEDVAHAIVKAARTRRPEIFVPRLAGVAATVLAVTPAPLRARLHRRVIPNQISSADQTQRTGYQRSALDARDDEGQPPRPEPDQTA